MFNVGDRVMVESRYSNWNGEGEVVSVSKEFDTTSVNMLTGNEAGLVGGFVKSDLTLIEAAKPLTVDDLRKVVDTLRQQGYTVDVTVTPPGTPITL